MGQLIAIAYGDETLAGRAAEEVARCIEELPVEPDATSVVVCERDGSVQLTTSRRPGATEHWSRFWSLRVDAVMNGGPGAAGLDRTVVDAPHIAGTRTHDVILAGPSANVMEGPGGNDTICGGEGADRISGGQGSDWIYGGPGDDRISGDRGDDRLDGGIGFDTLLGGEDAIF